MSYQIRVICDAFEIGEAVLGNLSITLGRSDLTQRIAQNSVSFRISRSKLEELIEAGPYDSAEELVFIGASILVIEDSLDRGIFYGRITDLSSDARTISVSGVDLWTFSAVACDPFDYPLATKTAGEHVQDLAAAAGLTVESDADPGPEISFGGLTNQTNLVGPLQELLTSTERHWIVYYPRIPLAEFDYATDLLDRVSGFGTPAYVFTSDQLKLAYSIKKGVADITNRVIISDAFSNVQTVSNQTNVEEIGPRVETLDTGLTSAQDTFERALFELGLKSPANWSLLQAETDANQLGAVTTVLSLVPNKTVNCAGVDAFGFANVMNVEQVRWTISKFQWTVTLLLSNAAHTGPLQRWEDAEITAPTLSWENTDASYTWDTLLYTDL